MDDVGWNVTETAARLGCERGTLSRLLNGKAGVSANMALALEDIGWGTADHWMRMQASYQLAQARRERAPQICARAQCTHDSVRHLCCRTAYRPGRQRLSARAASDQVRAIHWTMCARRCRLMRLSWNEVRAQAAKFVKEWADATYEKGETQSFYNAFFRVFGVQRRSVARYETHVAKLDNRSGFIDLFWPGVLLVEQKSAGRDLKAAFEQAGEYFDALPERDRPRFILVSDFQNFELHDLDERETVTFALSDLPEHVEAFGFILGVQRRTFRDQDPANIQAAELVGRLHDALADAGHRGHDLERFLVRVVFCMFADDTGVFEPRDIFLDFIEVRTGEDGADLGPWLAQLFEVLDTPDGRARGDT